MSLSDVCADVGVDKIGRGLAGKWLKEGKGRRIEQVKTRYLSVCVRGVHVVIIIILR